MEAPLSASLRIIIIFVLLLPTFYTHPTSRKAKHTDTTDTNTCKYNFFGGVYSFGLILNQSAQSLTVEVIAVEMNCTATQRIFFMIIEK